MISLEYVENYLYKALVTYRNDENFEDAIQEGLIRAWKDVQENTLSEMTQSYINHRAKQWAKNFIRDSKIGRRRPTGAPLNSKEGRNTKSGVASREKISIFMRDYSDLHDKEPSNIEIAQATGLSAAVVSYQRKAIREGRHHNNAITVTDQDGRTRTDYTAYSVSHFTTTFTEDIIFNIAGKIEWEDETIAEMDFFNLLDGVDQKHKQVLFWHHFMGYNSKEIAGLLGFFPASNTGHRHIKAAHKAVHALLDPSVAPPKPMLERAPRGPIKQKVGRAVATHCKANHEIRGIRKSSGKRYCKICNSLRCNPGRIEADIAPDSKLWSWDEGARPDGELS